ncbi:hypothetical protein BD779DRAFT_1609996 [Infundibulicybe gibba]|nr:hypothetical protein BD779DRAFT_1609996 [Infundibulicybe gibba]
MHLFSMSIALAILASARLDDVTPLDDLLLFDAPAFPDPNNPKTTLVSQQAFVSLRDTSSEDSESMTPIVDTLFSQYGLEVGNKLPALKDRTRLFKAKGLPGKRVSVNVVGCSKPGKLSRTALHPNLGIALQNISVGHDLSSLDSRKIQSTVFASADSGFGVISDIDDTVKISHVLNKTELFKSTFLDDPKPVPGMPQLYASLAKSLDQPQFLYISGSPFQLYPFLNEFIGTTFSASRGPLFFKNFTFTNVSGFIDFAKSDGILEYKAGFLMVGDSTQKDPETYGAAFRKYGSNIVTCIWIRKVDGADNSLARFAAAFKDVPSNKYRIYKDTDIPSLARIDVAGGAC